jgi:hypothetical protein
MDLYSNAKAFPAVRPVDFATDAEGVLIDCRGYSGRALFILSGVEDANQAATELLDITVHNVAADTEAPVAGNKVASFTQIVGQNDATPDAIFEQIAVDLNDLDPAKPYLQVLMTETNTWEGLISVVGVLGGPKEAPANS